jgi:hypothetical protein
MKSVRRKGWRKREERCIMEREIYLQVIPELLKFFTDFMRCAKLCVNGEEKNVL